MPNVSDCAAKNVLFAELNVALVPLIVTDETVNASVTATGMFALLAPVCTMYASASTLGESGRRHEMAGPAESTITGSVTLSGMLSLVGEVTVADSANEPSVANWKRASAGDGTFGDEP